VLWRSIEQAGPEAALRNYKELRAKYLERGSYDFTNGPVNMVGERLLQAHRWREALPLLEFNAESHPDASWSLYLLGEARLAGGDGQNALLAFEKAVALDPGNGRARRRMDELRLAAPPKP
jgi:tetratricopeptide (TPR) repeat protein